MNKKYYKLNEDRWELPDFDEYKGKKHTGYSYLDYDPILSNLEWEDFDNSDINWSGMSYRTKKERERDEEIISKLEKFFDDTESIRVTGEDKLEEGEYYCRLSFPRWSTKIKKYYKDLIEPKYTYDRNIDLNEDNTDEIRRLIKYYPEYNPSKYLFKFRKNRLYNNIINLTKYLLCIVEELKMRYNGKELIPLSKNLWWNTHSFETFSVVNRK